jgi:hypothetical protein
MHTESSGFAARVWFESEAIMDLIAHLHKQITFSKKTFGHGPRTSGVIDHIRKELLEIENSPYDVNEWVDVIILALDGAWRAGYTPEEVCCAILEKQRKNEARKWPDYRIAGQDKAIEHVREQGE